MAKVDPEGVVFRVPVRRPLSLGLFHATPVQADLDQGDLGLGEGSRGFELFPNHLAVFEDVANAEHPVGAPVGEG